MRIKLTRTKVEVVADEVLPKYIVDALQAFVNIDQKIHAIKLLRGYMTRNDDPRFGVDTTCGLKEAKDFIEENFRKYPGY